MEIINIYLKPGEGDTGVGILKGLGVTHYSLVASSTCDLITIERPLEKTDKILDSFQEEFKFSPEENRFLIIQSVDVILPREEEIEKRTEEISSRESIIQFAQENCESDRKYLLLLFFSAVVATLGLLADNTAVVVGAMIIAPAFGPLAGLSV
ncbi:MAG: hypothetical protein JXB14_04585, partial [Candidatus Altiarchaeota archaeon]|nr:hypothetical protein [Candidatus Altiarchaeota archaeon]